MLLSVNVGESNLGCMRDEEERKLHVGAQCGQCAHFIRLEVARRAQQAGYASRLSELD
jgi:bacterioferritin-associated ferredoxin